MENLSILIPVYNEEKAIGDIIKFFEAFVKQYPSIEVIFINDGSTDRTTGALGAIRNERIKVVSHSRNKGYGAAVKTGVQNAQHGIIAIADADRSYPIDRIPELFIKLKQDNADMVVGSRTGCKVKMGMMRRFGKFILKNLCEYLSGEKIPDFNSGLRIIKKELVLKFLRFLPDGFSFTTTITLSLLANNNRISYVPIDYQQRKGRSKINPIKDPFNFLQLIVRTVMFFNPLKVFLPLSLLFILLSFAVLIISYYAGRIMDITTIVLFTTGLNLLAIGLLADLIDKRLTR